MGGGRVLVHDGLNFPSLDRFNPSRDLVGVER